MSGLKFNFILQVEVYQITIQKLMYINATRLTIIKSRKVAWLLFGAEAGVVDAAI